MVDWNAELKTKKDNKMEWYDVIGQAVINTPKSAYEFGKNIVQPIIHPIETGKATARLAMGAVEKIPGAQIPYTGTGL